MRTISVFFLAITLSLLPCFAEQGSSGGSQQISVYAGGAFIQNGRFDLPLEGSSLKKLLERAGGLTLFGNPVFFILWRDGVPTRIEGADGDFALQEGDFVFATERMIPTTR